MLAVCASITFTVVNLSPDQIGSFSAVFNAKAHDETLKVNKQLLANGQALKEILIDILHQGDVSDENKQRVLSVLKADIIELDSALESLSLIVDDGVMIGLESETDRLSTQISLLLSSKKANEDIEKIITQNR